MEINTSGQVRVPHIEESITSVDEALTAAVINLGELTGDSDPFVAIEAGKTLLEWHVREGYTWVFNPQDASEAQKEMEKEAEEPESHGGSD